MNLRVQTDADTCSVLNELGEFFAAGFMEGEDAPVVARMARGILSHLARCPLPPYEGEAYYPCGRSWWDTGSAVWHHYVKVTYDGARARAKREAARTERERAALDALAAFWKGYPPAGGYTHSIPNYGRVLREGLDGFEGRIREGVRHARERGDEEALVLYDALLTVLDGVRVLHARLVRQIEGGACSSPEAERRRERLLDALRTVPFKPAQTFREAMVSTHLVNVLDGCDNFGRFDQFMRPYYGADLKAGRIERAEALEMVGALWDHLDRATGWNVALGGSTPDGRQAANELTLIALEAGRARRRPNLALRLREDTPEEVWDAALDTIATGNGLPALYGEENYFRSLREAELNISERDLPDFAFGGCTETMVHGCSNVGSLDGDFNTPLFLEQALHADLERCDTFDAFLARYRERLRDGVQRLTDAVSAWQKTKALYYPQLIRTLLIDDCIESGREYAAGGARYNWSVINIDGLANVIDSLCAVREVVFERGEVGAAELLRALRDDFKGHEKLHKRLERCPRYGNGDERADGVARELSGFLFSEFLQTVPWRGGRFLPACLMFVTYADKGKRVGATPDGRHAASPIADSAGAHQGRDRSGPTALLRSVCALDLVHAPGTMVVNIRLSERLLRTAEERDKVKALIRSYFRMGGMQVQVSVVDQAVLRDALEHPARYEGLVIRVGGYSEYWSRLSRDLQLSILERTEHG